jgi:PAS domain S-box-containing protein
MTWHFQPYVAAYFLNAFFAALFCVISWRRRSTPGVTAFAFLMLAIADWTFLRALEAMAVETWAKVFWAKLEYTGIGSVGVLWLLFTARFTDQDAWINRRVVGSLWIIPALTVLVALSNDWHHLLWTDIHPALPAGGNFLIYHHGPWFWVILSYSYLTLLFGSFLLVRAIVHYPRLYRHRIAPLLIGAGIPWIGNLIYASGLSPIPGLDPTPFLFTVVGFIYYWSIFRSRLFETVPIAHNLLIENINDGVIVLDNMNRIVDLNPAARRYITATDNPIGKDAKTVFDWLPPSVTQPQTRSTKHFDLTAKPDISRFFTVDISPLRDRHDFLCGYLIMMRDITEQKKAQARLIESERRYREHVEDIGDIVYLLDKDRKIKYINNLLAQQVGRTVDARNPKDFREIVTPGSYARVEGLLERGGNSEGKRIFEIELAGPGNREKIFEVSEKTIMDGGRVSEIHGIGRDITDRKRAEKEQKESEERYRELVENIDDIVYVTDASGNIIFLNKAFERISGYTRQEMLKKNYMDILTPESLIDVLHLFKKQEGGYDPGIFEMSFFDKKGAIKTIEVREKHIRKGKRLLEVHGLGRDITEKRMIEQQLLQAEKLSAVGTMISGVAHELNNPLTSIIGNAQLIAQKDVPEDIKRKLKVILKESIRSSKIVAGLLAFAREHRPEQRMIDINNILSESIRLREYDFKVSNIEIQMLLSDGLPETYADPYQIQQVFINLINNARDALTGREKSALIIRTYNKNGSIVVEFEDNGLGISREHINKIFDPFFTTKETGKGTGLGLSMAYGIVKKHGGDITVDSRIHVGTRFTVTIPITEGTYAAAERIISPPRRISGAESVLVVEDETSLRILLLETLTANGFSVDAAPNGEKAIDLIGKKKYDVVVTDIKMPGIDGKDLYVYIRKHHPDIADKIIFITGDILSKETRLFLESTKNRYIEKPFNMNSLILMLDTVLSG